MITHEKALVGRRKEIEEFVETIGGLGDRKEEFRERVPVIRNIPAHDRKMEGRAYFSDRYPGFAPGSTELFADVWSWKT